MVRRFVRQANSMRARGASGESRDEAQFSARRSGGHGTLLGMTSPASSAPPSALQDVLREVFGYPDFRPGQAEAAEAVATGRDAVVLLPTGGGKSLCYQVPAITAHRDGHGTTVVVSPLIALMNDQVNALTGRGVPAAALHSHQDDAERRDVLQAFRRGALALLYISPERAALGSFHRLLQQSSVALLAIDEAHCLSQWGHDFRPEYLRLHELRLAVDAPVLALTATATPPVVEEIVQRLHLRDPVRVSGSFARPNLAFSVQHHRTDDTRINATAEALEAAGLRTAVGTMGRALVYCATRKKTEKVANALKSLGFAVGYYHAGRTALARARAQRAFELRRTPVLVSTNAFGMGIDHPDVRLIVHFQAPGSLEAYYQEAGRAGRDGEAARCVLLFGPGDLVTQQRLQQGQGGGATVAARRHAALSALASYASDSMCRQQKICTYFTGDDQALTCGVCDVCQGTFDEIRAEPRPPRETPTALPEAAQQTIVDAVGTLKRPVGKTALAKALRGSRAQALRRLGLLTLEAHGALRDHPETDVVATIEALLQEGRLARRGQKYPTVWLPNKPVRASISRRVVSEATNPRSKPRRARRFSDLIRALDNYRKRTARRLNWKPYMVFQRQAIVAIDRDRPQTHAALARIPGLGPAKIERFGDDIIDLVRKHAG